MLTIIGISHWLDQATIDTETGIISASFKPYPHQSIRDAVLFACAPAIELAGVAGGHKK